MAESGRSEKGFQKIVIERPLYARKQTIGESQMKVVLGTILMLATIPLATASDPLSLVYRAGITCGHLDFEGTSYEALERKISSDPSAPSTISGWIQLIRKSVQEGQKRMEISETLLRSNTRTLNETDSADVRKKGADCNSVLK